MVYDRQLTFGCHTEQVARKVKQRSNAIRRLANTEWGYDKDTLRSTYIATARSAIEYAAPAWIPWIAATNMEKLETSQRHAGRAISGLVKTSPKEAIMMEADLPLIQTRAMQLSIIAYERSLRVSEDNPRRTAANKEEIGEPRRRTGGIKQLLHLPSK